MFPDSFPTCGDDRGVNGSGLVNLNLTEGVPVTLYCSVTYAGKWAPNMTWSGMNYLGNAYVIPLDEQVGDMVKLTSYISLLPSRNHQGVQCTVYLEELPQEYYPRHEGKVPPGDLRPPEQNYTCGISLNVQCKDMWL